MGAPQRALARSSIDVRNELSSLVPQWPRIVVSCNLARLRPIAVQLSRVVWRSYNPLPGNILRAHCRLGYW
jgi:hypothetical protein